MGERARKASEYMKEQLREPDVRSEARIAIAVEDTVRDIGTCETLPLLVDQLAALMAENATDPLALIDLVQDMLVERFRELRSGVKEEAAPALSLAPVPLSS